jgi:hypothetical protein
LSSFFRLSVQHFAIDFGVRDTALPIPTSLPNLFFVLRLRHVHVLFLSFMMPLPLVHTDRLIPNRSDGRPKAACTAKDREAFHAARTRIERLIM